MIYLLVIIFFANDFFWLTPWDLPVHPKDAGLVLIFLGLAYQILVKRVNLALLSNGFTWCFLAYFLIVAIQAPLAAIYWDQPLLTSLIKIRHQFYYVGFALFVFLLRTPEDICRLMNILTVVALLLLCLGIADYLGLKVFYHQFAEGASFRSGIERAKVPAIDLLSIAYLWNVSRWSYPLEGTRNWWSKAMVVILLGAHFFRQGRFRVFSVLVASIWQLVVRGKMGVIAGLGSVALIAVVIGSLTMETNVFVSVFSTGVQDATEGTGTAQARLEQLEVDFRIFKEYPFMGGGTLALSGEDPEYEAIARKADLGYTHFLKHYGMLGMAWLAAFWLVLFTYTRKLQRIVPAEYRAISAFCSSYLIFFTISFLTLNHLMFRQSTLVMCLNCAILYRLVRSSSSAGSSAVSARADRSAEAAG